MVAVWVSIVLIDSLIRETIEPNDCAKINGTRAVLISGRFFISVTMAVLSVEGILVIVAVNVAFC